MHSSRSFSLDRITAIAVAAYAACWLASVVFVDVVSADRVAPIGYALLAILATVGALIVSTSSRREAANARRVPRIPGGNSRFAYRPISRHRGTVLMGSAPTLV